MEKGHRRGKRKREGEGEREGETRATGDRPGPSRGGRGGPESALMTSSSEHSRDERRGAVLVCKMMLGGRERGRAERGKKEGREREIGDERE